MASFSVSVPIDDAVHDAFSIFRKASGRQWARNFIFSFDSDPGGDIAGLDTPDAFQAATLYSGMTLVAAPAGVETGGEAAVENTYLLVPAKSKAGITVGYSIERVRGVEGYDSVQSLPKPSEPPMWTVGRFVTDNQGETLVVGSASFTSVNVGKRPTVALKHFRVLSSTQRKQVFVHCDLKTLSAKKEPAPVAFAQAALLFQGVVQDRPCIMCGLEPRPGAPCRNGCVLPWQRPSSESDYSCLKRNYNSYYGNFAGVSQVFMRPSLNIPFVNVSFPLTMRNRQNVDGDLGAMMRSLAIQDRMRQHGTISRCVFDLSAIHRRQVALGGLRSQVWVPQARGVALSSDELDSFLSEFGRDVEGQGQGRCEESVRDASNSDADRSSRPAHDFEMGRPVDGVGDPVVSVPHINVAVDPGVVSIFASPSRMTAERNEVLGANEGALSPENEDLAFGDSRCSSAESGAAFSLEGLNENMHFPGVSEVGVEDDVEFSLPGTLEAKDASMDGSLDQIELYQ